MQGEFTQVKRFDVACHMYGEFGAGVGSVYDRGAGGIAKIEMAAYKVCMKMSLKNIFDPCFSFVGQLQVLINITEGVNDGSLAVTFNIVSCLAQTAGV